MRLGNAAARRFAVFTVVLLVSCATKPEGTTAPRPDTTAVPPAVDGPGGTPERLGLSRPAEPEGGFYKHAPVFSTRPSVKPTLWTIARFGPVGMSIDLVHPPFTMKVGMIEKGSPAEATGKLKKGQFIESINGESLADIDPRAQLADILGHAEATDGVLKFMAKDSPEGAAKEVIVKVPVLGAYSETWPLDCEKSDGIVRGFADYLTKTGWGDGRSELNGPAMLFMLSTGEEKDLEVVRGWIKKTVEFYEMNPAPFKNWRIGWGGVPLAEYYLRTGDESILPVIRKYADLARKHHYLGGWAHGGTGLFPYMGGGHMNAAGTHVLAFLLLAKECGVEVDEVTLQSSLRQFFRFAGRGLNPYGDGRPEEGFVDNGRTAIVALAMAAAASLTPEGEDSLYAGARDVCALKSFYTTPWMLHGHTGGGIGEIWRSMVMGLLYEKRPVQYRSFMDSRKWFYELSRRFDGSFGILGGGRYDGRPGTTPTWGHAMGLSYTFPRKTLRITGAPKTEWCREFKLPTRPWGTPADDRFLSLGPCVDRDGNSPVVEEETLDQGCARFILMKLREKNVSEDTVRFYAHHQEQTIRRAAAQCAAGVVPQYMFVKPATKALFPGLVTELLKSNDPRVRYAGAYSVKCFPKELLTEENFSLLAGMVDDPEESWFVVDRAMLAMSAGEPEQIKPHIDRLLHFLEHDEWWLRNSALSALMPVIADKQCYLKIFPVLSRTIAANQRYNTLGPLGGLADKLKSADPVVQKAAVEMLGAAYAEFSQETQTREVPNLGGETRHLDLMARWLAACPGGLEKLLEVTQKRFPDAPLRHRGEFLGKQEGTGAVVKKALRPIILDEMVPEHVGRHYNTLVKMRDAKYQSGFAGGRNDPMDQLVGLYRNAGVEGYDWHLFGPDLKQEEWWYYTFDPIPKEQVPWDRLMMRCRRVTMPDGMARWHAPDFDPEKAGWKKGRAAFGQYMGKIPGDKPRCHGPGCWCGTKVNTLWDKEILLFQGKFRLPDMKEGHRYRLRVNDGDHVGTGGGYDVYVNGKRLTGSGRCPRRGEGGLPKGAFITQDWIEKLSGKEVTIAVKSFLRFNRSFQHKPSKRVPQGRMSVHFEEMKIPPFSHDQVVKAAKLVPMKSAEWQAKEFEGLDDDAGGDDTGGDDAVARREGLVSDGKFRWDGNFVPNASVTGEWVLLGLVKEIDDFSPGMEFKRLDRGRAPFKELTIKGDGTTNSPTFLWSGDILMNLSSYEALRMRVKTIEGAEHLFVEAGGFHVATGIPVGWKSPWCVMKRK